KHRLPQKLFIIHEFRLSELPDRNKILIRPGLATVLQMDGLGTVKTKLESFRQVTRHAKHFQIGFKVFLRHVDDPVTMTPKQVMKLHPQPAYISYQGACPRLGARSSPDSLPLRAPTSVSDKGRVGQ